MKTIKREKVSHLSICNSSKLPDVVIDGGRVKRWVGIGWVDERSATDDDLRKYPTID